MFSLATLGNHQRVCSVALVNCSHSWASHTLARHLCSSRVDFRQKAVNPAFRPQQHVKSMAGLPAQNLLAPSMGQPLLCVGLVVDHLLKKSPARPIGRLLACIDAEVTPSSLPHVAVRRCTPCDKWRTRTHKLHLLPSFFDTLFSSMLGGGPRMDFLNFRLRNNISIISPSSTCFPCTSSL